MSLLWECSNTKVIFVQGLQTVSPIKKNINKIMFANSINLFIVSHGQLMIQVQEVFLRAGNNDINNMSVFLS